MMLNVGFHNYVNVDKVVSIASYEAAPSKRMVSHASDLYILVSCTAGRKTRSIVVCESGHIITSAFEQDTLVKRLEDLRNDRCKESQA